MAKQRKSAWRSGLTATLLCVGVAGLVVAPSAVFALGGADQGETSLSLGDGFASFTPASVNPRLARLFAEHAGTKGSEFMRFTPAGATSRSGRSVTVAVRVDEGTARAMSARSALAAAKDQVSGQGLRIAPTRYNLGLSRGYQSFAQAPQFAKDLSDAQIPDLSAFKPSPGAKEKPSRFSARIALEEEQKSGRSPRTIDSLGDQTVDLGGSYSVTRNLDVTAGVRYSQDRDRLETLTNGKQDSQAVYVGTQFRF